MSGVSADLQSLCRERKLTPACIKIISTLIKKQDYLAVFFAYQAGLCNYHHTSFTGNCCSITYKKRHIASDSYERKWTMGTESCSYSDIKKS